MKLTYTPRGFRIASFKDAYGADCSIQESSLVAPHLWLGVDGNRMHLTPKLASALIPLLDHFSKTGNLPDPLPRKRSVK